MKMSNNPGKYEVLNKQYLRSVLEMSGSEKPDVLLCSTSSSPPAHANNRCKFAHCIYWCNKLLIPDSLFHFEVK